MATWVVDRTQDRRFPFRITIEQEGRTLLAVRAQRKRCEFLKIDKPFKDRPGTYEQIFFRTEQGVRAHRTSGRVELLPRGGLDVVIDSAELYPWKFPGARVTRRKLPVGDYALVEEERLVAVVERKTRENFLGNVHEIKGLHQQLAELGSYPHAAMVVEAQYADFGNPAKIGRWPASHLLRVVGEIAALHPAVPLVFAGNRKLANVWTQRFFAGVAAALRELPDAFEFSLLRGRFAGVPEPRLRRVLNQLRAEGRLRCEGRGRAARWVRVEDQQSWPPVFRTSSGLVSGSTGAD